MRVHRAVIGALAAALCGGCMVGPDYHPPRLFSPSQWGELTPPAQAPDEGMALPSTPSPSSMATWWMVFHDPQLTSLMEWASASNLDLEQAAARIRQARALRTIRSAALWPAVDAQADFAHEHTSGSVPTASSPSGQTFNLYQVGFDASWELDVFGGNRRAAEAASATLQAAEFDWSAVLVSLLGEVGGGYVTYRSLQQRIRIARDNVATQQNTLDLTRRLFAAGLATDLDVARAESQVATTASTIPQLTAQARQTMHGLGVLVGEPPMTLAADLEPTGAIPTGPPMVDVGIPSELLQRRPDLRRSERNLAASTADIGVAVRDLYPRFFVTGIGALQSISAGDLFHWPSRATALGPSITWTAFDAGLIRATVDLRTAEQQELLAAYRESVLQAFQEVEDALVGYSQDQTRRDDLATAVASNQRAADLAVRLYTQGLTDFLSVLQAQFNLFASQDALAQSERDIALDLVALYKALGGGWQDAHPPVQTDDSMS